MANKIKKKKKIDKTKKGGYLYSKPNPKPSNPNPCMSERGRPAVDGDG